MSAGTYVEAVVAGVLRGVTELFPVSGPGHGVLVPPWLGLPDAGALPAVHLAIAVALVVFFRRDWARIVRGLRTSARLRRVVTAEQRLAWLLAVLGLPVALASALLSAVLRGTPGTSLAAAIFLVLNGIALLAAERSARLPRDPVPVAPVPEPTEVTHDFSAEITMPMRIVRAEEAADRRLARLGTGEAVLIAAAQLIGLVPGLSGPGLATAAGVWRGLPRVDAVRFAFLLATPAAIGTGLVGAMGTPSLFATSALVAALAAGVAGYLALRWLVRHLETRTLTPFAGYCVIAGLGSLAYLLA